MSLDEKIKKFIENHHITAEFTRTRVGYPTGAPDLWFVVIRSGDRFVEWPNYMMGSAYRGAETTLVEVLYQMALEAVFGRGINQKTKKDSIIAASGLLDHLTGTPIISKELTDMVLDGEEI